MKSLLVSLLVFIFVIAANAVVEGDVPFQVVARGQNSGDAEAGIKVFRTSRAFEEFAKDKGQDIPRKLVKEIDWDKEQLVVVSGGQQSTGGYSVDVRRIQIADIQRLNLEAILRRPSPGALTTQAITTPFVVVKMPRQVCTIKLKFVDQ